MSVLIKGMEMPQSCGECRWFYFQGSTCTDPSYFLDSRCKLIQPTQDWYGYDSNGGWVGDDIDPNKEMGYYYYHHCVQQGTRAKQCPLVEVNDGIEQITIAEAKQKGCGTCKHFPPNTDWPCVDCDMSVHDRWE